MAKLADAIMTGTMARPSRPSVRVTAGPAPTMMKAPKARMNQPNSERFLVDRSHADLVFTALNDTTPGIELETSEGASLSELTFSHDGSVLAGIVNGRMRVWDAKTGGALLR